MLRDSKRTVAYVAPTTKEPSYAYGFSVNVTSREEGGLTATVNTNQYGDGYVSIKGYNIPIDLIGKGLSKARKKVAGIAQWWIDQAITTSIYERSNEYLHDQKRESQRARKKMRNASRKAHHAPSANYRTSSRSLWGNW